MQYAVFFAVLILYFYNLGFHQVWSPNEGFYADASRNMLKTGDFLTPVFNGDIRLNKPPMTYWLTSLSFSIFGINEFALRFFQAVLGFLTALITYDLARRLLNGRSAVISFLAISLSFLFFANSRYTSPEVPLTFFITLSIYLWFLSYQKNSPTLFILALTSSSFAVLTKGPVGFVMPALIIFIYLLFSNPKELLKVRYYLGTLYVLILSGWWYVYQYLKNREELIEVFVKENIRRIYAMESDPLFQHILDVNVSFLPYSFILYFAILWAFKKKELRLPLVWVLSFLIIFSLVKMKLPTYIMPAYPAMAILVGAFLSAKDWDKVKLYASLFLGTLMMLAIWVASFIFSTGVAFALTSTLLSSLFLLLTRRFVLFPAVTGAFILIYLTAILLPPVEAYRPYREIGNFIKEIDPDATYAFYEVGAFHYNLPFYTGRKVITDVDLSKIEGKALVLVREDLANCEPLKEWVMYKGSESKLFKFIMDTKRGKNVYRFRLCMIK